MARSGPPVALRVSRVWVQGLKLRAGRAVIRRSGAASYPSLSDSNHANTECPKRFGSERNRKVASVQLTLTLIGPSTNTRPVAHGKTGFLPPGKRPVQEAHVITQYPFTKLFQLSTASSTRQLANSSASRRYSSMSSM